MATTLKDFAVKAAFTIGLSIMTAGFTMYRAVAVLQATQKEQSDRIHQHDIQIERDQKEHLDETKLLYQVVGELEVIKQQMDDVKSQSHADFRALTNRLDK